MGIRGVIETTKIAKDPRRVLYVDKDGCFFDLPPTGGPPIIHGVTEDALIVDFGERTLQGEITLQKIKPQALGLTAQALQALKKYVFNQ